MGNLGDTLELTLVSAILTHDSPDFEPVDTYAKVKVGQEQQSTKVASEKGRLPAWSDALSFHIPKDEAQSEILVEIFAIAHGDDKLFGLARIPLPEVVDKNETGLFAVSYPEEGECGQVKVAWKWHSASKESSESITKVSESGAAGELNLAPYASLKEESYSNYTQRMHSELGNTPTSEECIATNIMAKLSIKDKEGDLPLESCPLAFDLKNSKTHHDEGTGHNHMPVPSFNQNPFPPPPPPPEYTGSYYPPPLEADSSSLPRVDASHHPFDGREPSGSSGGPPITYPSYPSQMPTATHPGSSLYGPPGGREPSDGSSGPPMAYPSYPSHQQTYSQPGLSLNAPPPGGREPNTGSSGGPPITYPSYPSQTPTDTYPGSSLYGPPGGREPSDGSSGPPMAYPSYPSHQQTDSQPDLSLNAPPPGGREPNNGSSGGPPIPHEGGPGEMKDRGYHSFDSHSANAWYPQGGYPPPYGYAQHGYPPAPPVGYAPPYAPDYSHGYGHPPQHGYPPPPPGYYPAPSYPPYGQPPPMHGGHSHTPYPMAHGHMPGYGAFASHGHGYGGGHGYGHHKFKHHKNKGHHGYHQPHYMSHGGHSKHHGGYHHGKGGRYK